MKNTNLRMEHYRLLKESFKKWLKTLGYSASAIKSYPSLVRELLIYLEKCHITHISLVEASIIMLFFSRWKKRKNQATGGALSVSYINSMVSALQCFLCYLEQAKDQVIRVSLKREREENRARAILSRQEIKRLYEVCDASHPFGMRDLAMLAVYYGCALRKAEGIALDIEDIHLEKGLLIVKKGKGSKEREVPVTGKNLSYIKTYLYEGRDWFLAKRQKREQPATSAFFVNIFGGRMKDFSHRLRYLQGCSGDTNLSAKRLSLHILRHSIATHLLAAGMKLEQVAAF